MKTKNVSAYGFSAENSPIAAMEIPRREPLPTDVEISILFCGICHSDLHHARNELSFMPTTYPFVPGHEIIGRVASVGFKASKYKPGDLVGVGCLVDSDRTCPYCQEGLEQFCYNPTITIGSPDKNGTTPTTHGGFSSTIVVEEHFVLRVPENIDPAGAAPLLCAGITTYSPLKHWKVGPGQRVGVIGLGGLGHMAVKFAKAFGAEVIVFTTSPGKIDAAKKLGADYVVVSKNEDEMTQYMGTVNFIVDTVSAPHDINPYLQTLTRDGHLVILGISEKPFELSMFSLFRRHSVSSSNFGSIAETQEMLDFCGEHNITSDIELISISDTETAFDRLEKGDVKYRFVIDMATLTDKSI